MSIKDSKTRVTFVTEIETLEDIKRLVEFAKLSGQKMTVSTMLDKAVREFVDSRSFFGVDNFPS
jgi:hypothetical protein